MNSYAKSYLRAELIILFQWYRMGLITDKRMESAVDQLGGMAGEW